jgi:hypothetical protein
VRDKTKEQRSGNLGPGTFRGQQSERGGRWLTQRSPHTLHRCEEIQVMASLPPTRKNGDVANGCHATQADLINSRGAKSSGPAIRSRRRASIRVVGTEAFGTRHATVVQYANGPFVLEVFTFEEYSRFPRELIPSETSIFILPGLGWLTIRRPLSELEKADIDDVCARAKRLYDESVVAE